MYSCSIIRILETGYEELFETTLNECTDYLEKREYVIRKVRDVNPVMSDLKAMIFSFSRKADLVLVLGATGLMKEDIATEAVLSLIDKRASGIEAAMSLSAIKERSDMCLYRITAGVIKSAVILSIPGFPNMATVYLEPVIEHIKTYIDDVKKEQVIHDVHNN